MSLGYDLDQFADRLESFYRKTRRDRFAAQILASMCSSGATSNPDKRAHDACMQADALIRNLDH